MQKNNFAKQFLLFSLLVFVGALVLTPFMHQHDGSSEPPECFAHIVESVLVGSTLSNQPTKKFYPKKSILKIALPVVSRFLKQFYNSLSNKAPPVYLHV